jgi:prevent-host-death family protein
MRRIYSASEFKAKCLKLLDQVERTKQPIIITKRGKPVARLGPALLGIWKGRMEITGDVISPIDVEWEALK